MNKYASIILTVIFIAMAAFLILFDLDIIKEADPSQTTEKPVSAATSEASTDRNVTFVDMYTSGLKFELSFTGDSYIVSGIESSNLAIIFVPPTYSGKPVTEIGDYAFHHNTTIKYVKLPESVTKINDYAFFECTNLIEVWHNDSVMHVGNSAFMGSGINSFKLNGENGQIFIGANAFKNCTALKQVFLEGNMQILANGTFSGCSALGSVRLPESLETIGEAAFNECNSLKIINIPVSLNVIGDAAFAECQAIEEIFLPDTVTDVGEFAFRGCLLLTDFRFSSSMTKISTGMFNGCISLTSIGIPDNIKEIGYDAFRDTPISKVILPKELTTIASALFYNCKELRELNIPQEVTSIEGYAFYGCGALESIHIPKNVSSIDASAFYGCSALSSITVSGENEHFRVEDGKLISKKDGHIIFAPQKDNKQ